MDSIFNIFQDLYGRKHKYTDESPPCNNFTFEQPIEGFTVIHFTGLPHKFHKSRLRADLKIEQRIIVFRFLIALENAKELTTHDLIL